MIGERKLTII